MVCNHVYIQLADRCFSGGSPQSPNLPPATTTSYDPKCFRTVREKRVPYHGYHIYGFSAEFVCLTPSFVFYNRTLIPGVSVNQILPAYLFSAQPGGPDIHRYYLLHFTNYGSFDVLVSVLIYQWTSSTTYDSEGNITTPTNSNLGLVLAHASSNYLFSPPWFLQQINTLNHTTNKAFIPAG
ncbi:hypothetical protein BDQ17DRAFT_995017 [Cyathus striatus]|nr:hypothetical protein BDQ17DRAFT_995017 [Cyathus striatus]